MGKVSIGLRGWRFDEAEVFTEDGEFKPPEAIPPETRRRLSRLPVLTTSPCHACYLLHGEEEIDRCNLPAAVWGEPHAEVILCTEHEPDFLYWFREAGGAEHAGEEALQDAFHAWFADGGRAPADYGGLEHVDTDPTAVPSPTPPDPDELALDPPEGGRSIDLREYAPGRRCRREP